MLSKNLFDEKTLEVNFISDYLTVTTPLPQYLPYPRFLLDTDLSHTAKLLYTLLLDRATLSQKNNWIDTQGHIYVIYPLSHLAKDLVCCISSVTRAFSELENAQLVERIRSGFSKPSRILLKVPYTTQNCAVTVCKNAEDDCAETSSMIAQKCTPNQRNKSNLKDSHLIRTTDAHLTFGEYRNVYLTEKEYNQLKADFSGLDSLIEQKTNELSGLTDYQKAMELSNEIEELRTRQEQAMQTWEEASLALEEFDK